MATGIPRKRFKDEAEATASTAGLDVSLQYDGKKPETQILSTPPADVTAVLAHRASNSNRLFFGENLGILSLLLSDPAVRGQVRLVYIDPPFATKSVFQSRSQADAYRDLLIGAHYVEFLRERLVLLRELLAEDGSIYVHLDDKMAPYIKVVMDEVFGRQNFRNWITRKKCNPKNYTRNAFGNVTDYVLFYSKSERYLWNRPVESWTAERPAKEYQYVDAATGRRYMKVPVHAPGVRNGETGKPWRGKCPPPGKHWQFPPERLDELDAQGLIYWSPTGNPRRKIFLDDSVGVAVQDLWLEFRDAHNQNIRISGYPTEKNPALLARIIEASSNPGDLVIDCFSGSGTTLAVASALGRRWIGVDNSREAIGATLKRFAFGLEPMGDFVEKKPKVSSIHRQDLPLFPKAEKDAASEKRKESTTVIRDFSLYAASDYVDEAKAVIGSEKREK